MNLSEWLRRIEQNGQRVVGVTRRGETYCVRYRLGDELLVAQALQKWVVDPRLSFGGIDATLCREAVEQRGLR
jgi:hypothetical protein